MLNGIVIRIYNTPTVCGAEKFSVVHRSRNETGLGTDDWPSFHLCRSCRSLVLDKDKRHR
jgi:hypothetical protein